MNIIRQQIQTEKASQQEYLKELYYIDYCNNCKTGLSSKHDIPCHHPWFCWHTDDDDIGNLQRQIVELDRKKQLTSQEYYKLKELKDKRYQKIKIRLRKWRRTNL